MVKTRRQSYGYSRNIGGQRETGNAEGGTRTPTPCRAQRPERCVSTNFTTSAQALYYCIPCHLSIGFSSAFTPRLFSHRGILKRRNPGSTSSTPHPLSRYSCPSSPGIPHHHKRS